MARSFSRRLGRVLCLCSALWSLAACSSGGGPGQGDPTTAQQLLVLVNQARAQARSCGTTDHEATGPLRLDARLNHAAQSHSEDMLDMRLLTHTGSDGSNPGQRITRAGYTWATWGETAAQGHQSPEQVVAAWLRSPGHCRIIMGSAYQDFGAGEAGHYWTQVFARPN